MQKLLKKLAIIATMILTMTGLLTSVMTYVNLPDDQAFVQAWIPTWIKAALILAPAGFLIMWVIGKFVEFMLPTAKKYQQMLMQGALMALAMESLMATVTTSQLHGFQEGFWSYWLSAMAAGLPVGIAMSVFMTILVKPRLDAFMMS